MKISINLDSKEKSHVLRAFIVFVRAKTGIFLFDLNERFDVSVSLISKTFTTWRIFFYYEYVLFPSQN